MYTTVISFVAVLVASVSSLTINTPTNWKGNTTNSVTWTSTPSDPPAFSIELVNTQFNPSIAIANNVQTSQGSVELNLPRLIAGPDFTLQFVDVSNINNVLAMSSPFTIAENDVDSTSSSTISAASTASGTPGGPISTSSDTGTASATVTTATIPSTPTSTGASTTNTAASTSSTKASSPSPTPGGARSSVSLPRALLATLLGFIIFTN